MARVMVSVPSRTYPVMVAQGVFQEVPRLVRELGASGVALVTDAGVEPHWAEPLVAGFTGLGLACPVYVAPAGESAKSLAELGRLLAFLEAAGIDRQGVVVALGGGSVGDLAGFAAAVWLRGVRLVQVPTTLLAMVDSSVGGKTGVDSGGIKNAVGAFWQPVAVAADPGVLTTLPGEEYLGAFAEVVKYAVALDADLFTMVDGLAEELRAADPAALEPVVTRCVELKARVVAGDERDQGAREILNYGHTVAHALESASGYRLGHGRAVALGLTVEARISAAAGLCATEVGEAQAGLLARFELPGRAPRVGLDQVLAAVGRDKKAVGGMPRWVLPRRIGRAEPGRPVDPDVVRREVAWLLGS